MDEFEIKVRHFINFIGLSIEDFNKKPKCNIDTDKLNLNDTLERAGLNFSEETKNIIMDFCIEYNWYPYQIINALIGLQREYAMDSLKVVDVVNLKDIENKYKTLSEKLSKQIIEPCGIPTKYLNNKSWNKKKFYE